jgi:hypothetical protein
MFLRIDHRVLRLLGIGILQLVSRGAQIPEVAAVEILLRGVEVEGTFLLTEMVLSNNSSLPRIWTSLMPLPCSVGGLPATVGGGSARHCLSVSWKMLSTSRSTLAISDWRSDGSRLGG